MALPDRPSLEYLKKLAKDRLRELRRAEAGARLADAQLAVAREHGFPSWRALRAHLDAPARAERAERVAELFAAILHGGPRRSRGGGPPARRGGGPHGSRSRARLHA
jgi:hypothetical protein